MQHETQLSLTNRATRLEVSSRSPNMVPFHMLRSISYYCAIVTLSVKRTVFFRNSTSKMSWHLKTMLRVREGHWKCHHSVQSLYFLSHWRSIVSRVVSEILNVGKYRDLEIPAKGQSRSSKVVPFDRLRMVFY